MSGLVVMPADAGDMCSNCRWWTRNHAATKPGGDPQAQPNGVCRRYPPSVVALNWVGQAASIVTGTAPPPSQFGVVNFGTISPTTQEAFVCGEHQPPQRLDS
jgi:hypothetical protein